MKKLLTLFACMLVAFTTNAQSTQKGDVNGDGDISVNDVAMIVNHILGMTDSNFIISNADINGDGEIDINDVMATVKNILEGDTEPQAYLTCPDDHHPHMIDLGLPSGTLWACCNVGTDMPDGDYGWYAWGEIEEKNSYSYTWTNYLHNNDYYELGGDIAGSQYDVAHVKWGGSWVIPHPRQFTELIDNCSCSSLVLNKGDKKRKVWQFTGPNGGSIVLPANGRTYDNTYGGDYNNYGYYWTSIPNWNVTSSYRAYALVLSGSKRTVFNSVHQVYIGCSIRPVWVP